MSQTFKGDITNNVVELNLQAGATNIGTPTVAYDGTNNGEIAVQVMGDVDSSSGFNGDTTLKGLVIGTSCTSIGSTAFQSCAGFTGSLTIPNSVTTIGSTAFQSCAGFTGSLTIPNSVTSIGSNSFDSCSNLTSIAIPESVASIGSYAFYYCSNAAIYTNCPASSWVGTGACSGITNIYLGPNAVDTGYTNNWQAGFGSGPTVSTWTNYPNIP